MRIAHFAAALILAPFATLGFEIEDQARFGPADGPALRILSTGDLAVFRPLIEAFQAARPGGAIVYTQAASTEVMRAIYDEGAAFDLVLSSAMDLQTKLANDGLTRPHVSEATAALPPWARWRDRVIAFAQEPAVLIAAQGAFQGLERPTSRAELTQLLRANPERFRGRIGTYDIRASGLGYLFATQDSRNSESYWQLMESMGRLDAQLYCCSGEMIADVRSGRLSLAYNVLGGYVDRFAPDAERIEFTDVTNLMLRSAVIPKTAENPEAAGDLIDFLILRPGLSPETARTLPPISGVGDRPSLRPIAFGPELLVFLDALRRRNFLASWAQSMEQR